MGQDDVVSPDVAAPLNNEGNDLKFNNFQTSKEELKDRIN